MSTLPPSQGAATRAARRIVGRDSAVRRRIEQRFAQRRARRLLVGGWVALLVAAAALPLAGRLQDAFGPGLIVGGVGVRLIIDPFPLFIIALALGWLIRTAVRRLADLPDEDIDERQIALRDRTYVVAYRIAAATVLWVLLAAYIVADAAATRVVSASVKAWLASDLFFVLLVLLAFLPSAVLAWYSDDEPQDDARELTA